MPDVTETTELPAGNAPIEPPAAPEPELQATAAEGEIRIGDKTFKTQDEAFAFATEELQRKNHEIELADAYRAGVSDRSSSDAPAAPLVPESEADQAIRILGISETEFYENIPGALLKLAAKIREDVTQEVRARGAAETAEQAAWREFYTRHPDLEGFDEDVRSALVKHEAEVKATVRTKGKDAGYALLAQKTKKKFQDYADKLKPKTALPNGSTATPPKGQTNVTQTTQPTKILSMAEQVRSIRK